MTEKRLVECLNRQLNREVTTFLRYMLQAASIKGAQWEGVRSMYLKEVQDEVAHAQYLANTIVALGASPKLDPDLTQPPSDVNEMLKNDAHEESKDVQNYSELATLAGEAGLVAIKMQMEEQAADEDRHQIEMRRLLGE